jgi:hypothetical protein
MRCRIAIASPVAVVMVLAVSLRADAGEATSLAMLPASRGDAAQNRVFAAGAWWTHTAARYFQRRENTAL